MATGGISEREDRIRRRNKEREIQELTSQTDRLLRESETALQEMSFDDIFRTRYSCFDELDERNGDNKATDDSMETNRQYQDRSAYSTPYTEQRPRRESVEKSLDKSEGLDKTEGEMRETEKTYRKERKSDPYRLGEKEHTQKYDDNFDLSFDDTLNEFKRRVRELGTPTFTVDEVSENENESKLREKDRKDIALEKKQSLLTEQEKMLNEKEMEMLERERKMTRREANLKEMEQALLDKMDQIEKEHLRRECNLKEKEQEITSYMKEAEKKMSDRIDKLESEYQRKEKDIKKREVSIEKMEMEWKEKLNHIPEIKDTKRKSVIKDTDTDSESDLDNAEGTNRPRQTGMKGLDNLNLKLNLTSFSGVEPVPRNEATFEEWKLEVECVKAIYSEIVVIQAIRKALKGQAKRIMLHLGPLASVEKIEKKLEDAFGNIASKDSILSHFFLAEQEDKESVVEWGLRLEDMLLQASRKTKIAEKEKGDMLKRKFWRGLRNEELQNATRVHFEREISYEELRKYVRSEEFEIKVQKERKDKKDKPPPSKAKQSIMNFQDEEGKHMMKLLIEKMEQLDKKVEDLKKENTQAKKNIETPQRPNRPNEGYRYNRGRGYNRGGYNRGRYNRGGGHDTGQEHNPKNDNTPEKTDSLNGKGSS